jgi:hypothetical protein
LYEHSTMLPAIQTITLLKRGLPVMQDIFLQLLAI